MTPLFTSKRALLCHLLLAYHVSHSIAFPSMLVESNGGCMIELSTEEVIMNNPVVAFEDSSRPDLYVAVVNPDGTYQKDDILLEPEKKEYAVTVVNPGEALVDVQYALEVTGDGASFADGGCQGKRRTHGRLSDKTQHRLLIDSTDKEIRIVAGWAGGHEAVQLTQALVLKPAKQLNDKKTKDVPASDKEDEESGHVLGVQVVEKHEPKDVNAKKIEEADILNDHVHEEKGKTDVVDKKNDKPANEAEDAHKDALNEEIKVLKEDVDKLRETKEEENETVQDEKVKEPKERPKDRDEESDKERIARFKQEYAKKHGKPKGDVKHGDVVQKFKDSFKEKHGKLLTEEANADGMKHADIIKRFKENFKEKHGIQDKKQRDTDSASNVWKHMHDAMRHDVTRRKGKESRLERVKRRYNDSDNDSRFQMSSYLYGLVFFVLAFACLLQTCLQIAKQDKGRRHE